MSPLPPDIAKIRDELAEHEANYFSHIQFPVTWMDTGTKDLKQDVNAARRDRCYNDHKWGFEKGFNAAAEIFFTREAEQNKYIECKKADLEDTIIQLNTARYDYLVRRENLHDKIEKLQARNDKLVDALQHLKNWSSGKSVDLKYQSIINTALAANREQK